MSEKMEPEEYQIITAGVFSPHKSLFKEMRNERATCSSISCNNSHNCQLFSRGECCLVGISGCRCPYGKYTKEQGFTKKARKYYSWINEKEKEFKGFLGNLSSTSYIMGQVGDYVYLPYSFMNMNKEIPFLSHGHVLSSGSYFVKKEDFTIDNIIKICNFIPRSLMGGEIVDYQEKYVPIFLKHLSETMESVYNELCEEYPRAKEIVEDINNIGRKAKLFTLKSNVGEFQDIHGATWNWNGTYLTSYNSKASFMLASKFSEIRIIPDKETIVKITDEKQVCKDTIFLT